MKLYDPATQKKDSSIFKLDSWSKVTDFIAMKTKIS